MIIKYIFIFIAIIFGKLKIILQKNMDSLNKSLYFAKGIGIIIFLSILSINNYSLEDKKLEYSIQAETKDYNINQYVSFKVTVIDKDIDKYNITYDLINSNYEFELFNVNYSYKSNKNNTNNVIITFFIKPKQTGILTLPAFDLKIYNKNVAFKLHIPVQNFNISEPETIIDKLIYCFIILSMVLFLILIIKLILFIPKLSYFQNRKISAIITKCWYNIKKNKYDNKTKVKKINELLKTYLEKRYNSSNINELYDNKVIGEDKYNEIDYVDKNSLFLPYQQKELSNEEFEVIEKYFLQIIKG